MSTATLKRSHSDAQNDAIAFCGLFPRECWEAWAIAGSVRRGRPEVTDVDHVVMPTFQANGLFGDVDKVNLLFHHLDALLSGREVTKHVYGTNESGAPVCRWGPIMRGVDFRGAKHEIWTASHDNWGAILAIRTGPAEFSERLVTQLRRQGYRNKDGYVWRCEGCPACFVGAPADVVAQCKMCDGTRLRPVERLSVPDERTYFELAGMKWAEPGERR